MDGDWLYGEYCVIGLALPDGRNWALDRRISVRSMFEVGVDEVSGGKYPVLVPAGGGQSWV